MKNTASGPKYDFIVHVQATKTVANKIFEYTNSRLKAIQKWTADSATYAIAVTKKVYSSYNLKFDFKWGERRFKPRLYKKKDAGLLYHCQAGTYAWTPSLEYQIQEEDCGDLWCLLGSICDVLKENEVSTLKIVDYSSSPKWTNEEKTGWKSVLLKVRGDSAKYYLN
ncbi:MAG: family 16 glycoside hydrolase [Maribacter stanieri]